MADNILKGTIKIDAPGVKEQFKNVADGATRMGTAVAKSVTGIDQGVNSLKKVAPATNQASNAMINLGRIVQDAPYGFIGIANNINPALESFQRLRAETGSTGTALKALGSSLLGAGGLGLGISVASSLLVVFGDKLFGAGKKAKEASDEIKGVSDVLTKAGNDYKEAVVQVSKLKDELDLAKKGFIDKKIVVNEYNQTIGETIGKVKTLDEVEKAIAEKGEAYIKFTLLKAAANKALEKSADEALKATLKQNEIVKPIDTKSPLFKGLNQNLNPEDAARFQQGIGQAFEGVNKKITKEVTKADNESKRFEDIAKDFFKQAADISSKFNFKFDGGKFDTKEDKSKKFEFLYEFLPFDANGKLKPEQRNQLLDSIDKFQKEFSGIIQGANFIKNGKVLFGDEKIQAAKELDLQIKAGKAKIDTDSIRRSIIDGLKNIKPEELPNISTDISVVDKFITAIDEDIEGGKKKLDFSSLLDTKQIVEGFKTQFAQIGSELPKTFEATNIFGQKVVVTFDDLFDTSKISSSEALAALRAAFTKEKDSFTSIGRQIGSKIGGGFGDAFEKIFSDALQKAMKSGLKGEDLENFKTQLQAITTIAATGIVGVADAFGQFADALLKGQNGMQAFGEALKGVFRSIAVEIIRDIVLAGILSALSGGADKISFLGALKSIIGGSHATGLSRVPKDGYIAELHKDEMVVPAKQAKELRPFMKSDFSVPSLTNLSKSVSNNNISTSALKNISQSLVIPSIQGQKIVVPSIGSQVSNSSYRNSANIIKEVQQVDVKVSGEFKQHGNSLVAVINDTQRTQRRSY